MKYKLTKAEQETVINFDNELDTASIYTHDSRLIKKLRELRKQYQMCIRDRCEGDCGKGNYFCINR